MSTIDPASPVQPTAADALPPTPDARIAGFELPSVRWRTPHGSCEAPVGHFLNSDAVVRNGLPAGYELLAIRQPDKCSHEATVVAAGQRTDEVDAVLVVRRDGRGRLLGAWGARLPSGATGIPPRFTVERGEQGQPALLVHNVMGIVGYVGAQLRYGRPDDGQFVPLADFRQRNPFFFEPHVRRTPQAQQVLGALGL